MISLKLNEFLLQNNLNSNEKLIKSQMLLESNEFELFLMFDPSKCLILLENLSFNCYDPNMCVLFSHLASQYNYKNIANQALRTFLKVNFNSFPKQEGFHPLQTSFLTSKKDKFNIIVIIFFLKFLLIGNC